MSKALGLSEDLTKRILFLLGALVIFRLGTHITIPFISPAALASLVQDQQGTILDMLHLDFWKNNQKFLGWIRSTSINAFMWLKALLIVFFYLIALLWVVVIVIHCLP